MSPHRILVVEDDSKVAGLIRLDLEHAGFAVDTIANGRAGLAQALAHPPVLVVLDVMLPDLPGFSVCRQLREHSDLPVLLFTARSAEKDRLEGLDLGADDYIIKPFSPRAPGRAFTTMPERKSPSRCCCTTSLACPTCSKSRRCGKTLVRCAPPRIGMP